MAVPSEARTAYKVESYLRKCMYSTMESEERSSLLGSMCKLGLSTREVISFMEKQKYSRRFQDVTKTGDILMKEKLRDSQGEEKMFREERKTLREELESLLGKSSHKYKRIIKRLKDKVYNARKGIRSKNKEKINKYKERQKEKKHQDELSSLP